MTVIDRALSLLNTGALYMTIVATTQTKDAYLVTIEHDVAAARLQLHSSITGDAWSVWDPDDPFEDHMDNGSGAHDLAARLTSWSSERLDE